MKAWFLVFLGCTATAAAGTQVTGMIFRSGERNREEIGIEAAFTIDASDWGDAVRLSGADASAPG